MAHEPVEGRVTRLEESAMFADQAVETLNEALGEMMASIERLSRRIEALETRLEDVVSNAGGDDPGLEPPPHSAGPDIPRDPI